jgi:hypothetical protein
MESWGKVRVDALELQDPCVPLFITAFWLHLTFFRYHRTDPAPLTEARQIAKMKALMTINRKMTAGGQADGNGAFLLFKEVERILGEAEMCDKAQEYLVAKEMCNPPPPLPPALFYSRCIPVLFPLYCCVCTHLIARAVQVPTGRAAAVQVW